MPREPRDRPWVVVFILLSLLAHLLFVVAIVLIGHFFPPPKIASEPPPPAEVALTLQPPPPPQMTPPKHIFMATDADPTAKPHLSQIESDHDANLHSQSTVARQPDSLLPDIVNNHQHATALRDAPNAPSTTPPRPASHSAAKSQQQQNSQQNNVAKTPSKSKSQQKSPQPSQSEALVKTPNPVKQPAKPVQYDPNGLPVLPALDAPAEAAASQSETPETVSSVPDIASDPHGALGTHGLSSPDAMATEFGKYKAKVYRAVGSRWYPKVDHQFQVMPVGAVHVQFTIHDDGSVETKVLSGNDGSLQILLSISLNAIREAAPFDPFTDTLRKEIAREQHNDGRSYTDDFTFSIYGG